MFGQHVSVQMRVSVAARSMTKRRSNQALAANLLDTTMTTARPHHMPLGELERSFDGVIVRLADRTGRVRITETEQHRHGLRRSKRQVETRHPMQLTQPCPTRWVMAGQHRPQRLRCDLATEAEQAIAARNPSPRRLAADVIVLDTLSDSIEVVPLLSMGELPHTQHGRTSRANALGDSAGTMVQIRDLKSGSSLIVRELFFSGRSRVRRARTVGRDAFGWTDLLTDRSALVVPVSVYESIRRRGRAAT